MTSAHTHTHTHTHTQTHSKVQSSLKKTVPQTAPCRGRQRAWQRTHPPPGPQWQSLGKQRQRRGTACALSPLQQSAPTADERGLHLWGCVHTSGGVQPSTPWQPEGGGGGRGEGGGEGGGVRYMCAHAMCETETKLCSATAMQAIVHIRSQRGEEGLNPPHGQPGVHLRGNVQSVVHQPSRGNPHQVYIQGH